MEMRVYVMLQFDEYKVKLNNLRPELEDLDQALGLEAAQREAEMLESESASDGFWDNLEKAQKVQQRIKNLQDKVDSQNRRQSQWDDLMALCEMGNEFEDESLVPELEEGFAKLEADIEEARLSSLLTGMPPAPILPGMICELGMYGFVTGFLSKRVRTGKPTLDVYCVLLPAMLLGRAVSGLLNGLVFRAGEYTMTMFLTASFVTALPGIAIQVLLIPVLLLALAKADLYAYAS